MDEPDLFRFVYDEYKVEFDHADSLYRKSPVVVTAIALVGGAVGALGHVDGFRRCFERVDYFLYSACAALAMAGLLRAAIYLTRALRPKKIARLGSVRDWAARWYGHDAEERTGLSKEIISQLGETSALNDTINRKRDALFARCMGSLSLSVPFAIGQAVMYFILRVQGQLG